MTKEGRNKILINSYIVHLLIIILSHIYIQLQISQGGKNFVSEKIKKKRKKRQNFVKPHGTPIHTK